MDCKAPLFSLSIALHFAEKHVEMTFCRIYLCFANEILEKQVNVAENRRAGGGLSYLLILPKS